ncbi:MAG: prepilin-type N-terminal cleavage/methylation protein [Candidatus Saccharibacteria bacterium]|nr:prepilin-type N-terminal cleavage/methylation protein [Candidatus Saccharibacteria bacterium]
MWAHKKQSAFTIVELLIVIVVIGILAAITIVAYNGIQDRARVSSVSSALAQAAKKISVWQVDTPATSPTCAEFNTLLNSTGSGCAFTASAVDYQYTAGTNGAYCITATTGPTSYKITESTKPTAGGCAGHGVGGVGAVTNVSLNPSAESNLTNFVGANGTTLTRTSTQAKNGTYSTQAVFPTYGSSGVGVNVSAGFMVPANMKASTTYILSTWVYVPAATTVNAILSAQGAGVASSTCSSASTATKDTWIRLSCSVTTTSTGNVALYVLNAAAVTSGMQFFVDSVMITEGAALSNYADGSSTDWIWNGTTNNSSSTGPPL